MILPLPPQRGQGAHRLHDAERRTLLDGDLAGAVAVGAGFGGAALLGAGAAAVGAGLQALDGDGLVAALDRLHKGQRNGNLHIRPLDRGVGVAGASAAAKAPKAAPAEEALEDIADIVKAEARRSAVTAGPAAVDGGVARVDAGKAELIVPAALFGIGENLIGLPGLLELGLGLLIPGFRSG